VWGCGVFGEVAGVDEVFVVSGLSADPRDSCAVDQQL